VVVYGSRPDGHARVIVETLRAEGTFEIVGLVDDVPANAQRTIDELRVVGTRSDLVALRSEGVEGVVLGFGAATGRRAVLEAVRSAGLELPILIAPSAHVAASAVIGDGVQVLAHACVGVASRIGAGALINTGAIVEHDAVLGECTVVDPGAALAGRVHVGSAVEIGTGAVLLPDVNVDAGATVGAGAVVTGDVMANLTVVGVPARPVE
jgi:UDP-perosamine 4-acetyltransferase